MSRDETEARSAWSMWRRNLVIWAAMLALLTLTLVLAYQPLGVLSIFVALGIATAKASLVLLLFMELRTSSNLVRLAAAAGAIWLLVLFLLTISDYLTRV